MVWGYGAGELSREGQEGGIMPYSQLTPFRFGSGEGDKECWVGCLM